MTQQERLERVRFYYKRHKPHTVYMNWRRQIAALGCTPELYAKLVEKQHGLCAICKGKNKTQRQLAVDHDHRTGAVRGLLCQRCNLVLGCVQEDSQLLHKMEDYLCHPRP